VVHFREGGRLRPMRKLGEKVSTERAFSDLDNFVRSPSGKEIPGNRGQAWRA